MTSKTLNKALSPIIWNPETETVLVIDQRLLPFELKYIELKNYQETAQAIKDMVLRGAPLIGITAAFGMALAAKEIMRNSRANPDQELKLADQILRNTRPTAVNLMWALDRIATVIKKNKDPQKLYSSILEEAQWILADDIERCRKMSKHGAEYIKNKFQDKINTGKKLRIMTHCNAGALATGGYGTALGVIRTLHEEKLVEMVYSDETRPRQQGSRLTAWELAYENIPVTMNTDGMAAHLMKQGLIDLVITGADRICTNGDAANKIGTYQIAISAKYHHIPFYIAAPMSTVDPSLSHGDLIPIEERDYTELSHINDQACTFIKDSSSEHFGELNFVNPGFDVTSHELIEAIFTEEGLYKI